MAPVVRYRYVDFGTVFTGSPGNRRADAGSESPATLFANELAADVGGTCWGANEPLAVIDHRAAQFPSASAAVLHKANRIREKVAAQDCDVFWLVTHKEPDFDAFCSMYLARWIGEAAGDAVDWRSCGLYPEAWDDPTSPKIDWFNLDLSGIPNEHRWPLLLAGYASYLDRRRRISCPRQRALHSILCAALKRGRDYLNESSGATEFFDEVRSCLAADQLNPLVDSVLEGSTRFAPELTMLDAEAGAYERDMQRARKSVVFLPEAEAPSARFFKTPKEVLAQELEGKSQDVNAEDLRLKDTFRIPTDGIYLRDPECLLFEEWARLDLENSALGAGFEFSAIATSEKRTDANHVRYVFSIAPDRARGRHLFTVWSRLQTREVEARRPKEEAQTAAGIFPGERAATTEMLTRDPWFGGQGGFGTVVRSPRRGTEVGPPGERSDLRDDPVVEEVRTELENAIYLAESLVSGPQVTVIDFARSPERDNKASQALALNCPLQIPPAGEGYFRYAAVRLRSDVPIMPATQAPRGLAGQIAETLWQVLYPQRPGAMPSDFIEQHVRVAPEFVGVWSDQGIAVAQKAPLAEPKDRDQFAAIVSLMRDADRLRTMLSGVVPSDVTDREARATADDVLKAAVAQSHELSLRAAAIQHELTSASNELLRSFSHAIGFDQLLTSLRALNQRAVENLRRQAADEARRLEEGLRLSAKLQRRQRWLQVFTVGFLIIFAVDVAVWKQQPSRTAQRLLPLLVGPSAIALSAWMLKRRKPRPQRDARIAHPSPALLAAVIVAALAAWLVGLLHAWGK